MVGGFPLADGTSAKVLTGIDDHSRMCVCAKVMVRERTRAVCDGLRDALAVHGVAVQILTDNGKVFTGRFNHPPVEVLFDAICREHGIEHLLTQPRSPTTTRRTPGGSPRCCASGPTDADPRRRARTETTQPSARGRGTHKAGIACAEMNSSPLATPGMNVHARDGGTAA